MAAAEAKQEAAGPAVTTVESGKKGDRRKTVMYDGREVYQWEQTLDEVEIFVKVPDGVRAKQLFCKIGARHLSLGIKAAARPYLDEDLGGLAVVDESLWTLEDGVLRVSLQKGLPGETWPCALMGAQGKLTPEQMQAEQQRIMLERFGKEHPGFDFSNAKFNGEAPDARTFMGGFNKDVLKK